MNKLPAKKTFSDEEVIAQIMQLFWQNGYYHTSMDEIVATSGVKKQSLYNAFGDKHTLYLKSLQHYHQQVLAACAQAMQQLEQNGESPLTVLMMLYRRGLAEPQQPTGDLMANAIAEFGATDSDVKQATDHFYEDYLTLMASVILKGQASQTIMTTATSMTLAQSLLEARIGLQMRVRQGIQPNIAEHERAWQAFLQP